MIICFFLVAESIDTIRTTFGNGAIDAWAVDALDTAGFTGVKDRLFSRVSQLTNTGWLLSAMVGAYVANVNIAWPWILGAAGYLTSLFVGAALMRGDPDRTIARPRLGSLLAEVGTDAAGPGCAKSSAAVRSCCWRSASAIQVAVVGALFHGDGPSIPAENLGVAIWVIGWLYFFFSIGRLLGAELIARFQPTSASRATLLASLALATGTLLAQVRRINGDPAGDFGDAVRDESVQRRDAARLPELD